MTLIPILRRRRLAADEVSLPARRIHDQGAVNCCFSCALSSAMEARDATMPALAPLYHFHFADGSRVIEEGLSQAEAKGALLRMGICAFSRHPLAISASNAGKEPDDAAIEDGQSRRPMDRDSGTLLWTSVMSTDPERRWKALLGAGMPIVIGIQPNREYLDLDDRQPTLTSGDPPYSGVLHAVVVLGYRDDGAAFVVQDSRRGARFGRGGQWFLPYGLATSPFVVMAVALAPED